MFKGNVTTCIGGIAPSIGRKGTSSDITLYNNKINDNVLSFVEPSGYPEKIQSLISSLNISDQVLFKINSLDCSFAETVMAIDLLNLQTGFLILDENIDVEKLNLFTDNTTIARYKIIENRVVGIRENLAKLELDSAGNAIVQVDHSFSVKGVGTVALGVVKQGVLKKYDELSISPVEGKAVVKSIQVNDVNVDEAVRGLRVGLSLKNTKPEDVPRGTILSTDEMPVKDMLDIDISLSKHASRDVEEGDSFMINSCLNYVPVKVVEGSVKRGERKKIKMQLEKPIPLLPEKRIILLDPGAKVPRVFGFGNF